MIEQIGYKEDQRNKATKISSDLNISTCVYIADTNLKSTKPQLMKLFECLNIIPYSEMKTMGLIKVSYRGEIKGHAKKDVLATKKSRKMNSTFRNQISFYTRTNEKKNTKFISYKQLPKPKKLDSKKSFTLNNDDDDIEVSHIFLKGKTMINFNSIRFNLKNMKSKSANTIRLFTSVPRKSHVHYLNDITHTITEENVTKGYIEFLFNDKNFADGIFVVDSHDCIDFNNVMIETVVETNMFLFSTGKIKITGTTQLEHAKKSLNVLIESFERLRNIRDIFGKFKLDSFDTIMINSDFCLDFELECSKLYQLFRKNHTYRVSYEPNTHPAVCIKFMLNETSDTNSRIDAGNLGICMCLTRGETCDCKSVSVLIFSSGKIILTGARKIEHIQIAFKKIQSILNENRELIEI